MGGVVDGTPGLLHLLDGDGDVGELREMSSGSSSSRALVPGSQFLQESNANDAHGPLEVLCPGANDRG